jgi:hypothetical protein
MGLGPGPWHLMMNVDHSPNVDDEDNGNASTDMKARPSQEDAPLFYILYIPKNVYSPPPCLTAPPLIPTHITSTILKSSAPIEDGEAALFSDSTELPIFSNHTPKEAIPEFPERTSRLCWSSESEAPWTRRRGPKDILWFILFDELLSGSASLSFYHWFWSSLRRSVEDREFEYFWGAWKRYILNAGENTTAVKAALAKSLLQWLDKDYCAGVDSISGINEVMSQKLIGDYFLPEDYEALKKMISSRSKNGQPNPWPSTEIAIWHPEVPFYTNPIDFNLRGLLSIYYFYETESNTVEFVKQLTRFTSEVYRKWFPAKSVTAWFVQEDSSTKHYARYMKFINYLVRWVASTIKKVQDLGLPMKSIQTFWIHVAHVSKAFHHL